MATDLDREGEAIAWHLCQALGLDPESVHRVTFNEITKSAIREAFACPGPEPSPEQNRTGLPPDLAEVAAARPHLPEAVKADILGMLKAAPSMRTQHPSIAASQRPSIPASQYILACPCTDTMSTEKSEHLGPRTSS